MMDQLTQDLINGREEQLREMKEWMKTKEYIFAPVEVKVAVIRHIDYCKGQIKLLER